MRLSSSAAGFGKDKDNRPLEPKISAAFKSALPFQEESKQQFFEYKNMQMSIHTRQMKQQIRNHNSVEKKHPFFYLINSH